MMADDTKKQGSRRVALLIEPVAFSGGKHRAFAIEAPDGDRFLFVDLPDSRADDELVDWLHRKATDPAIPAAEITRKHDAADVIMRAIDVFGAQGG